MDNRGGRAGSQRTHFYVTQEFAGGTIGLLIDNKTGDVGLTVGLSKEKAFLPNPFQTTFKMEWDLEAPGALTETISSPIFAEKAELFTGLGFAAQASLDLHNASVQPTMGVGKRGIFGVGIFLGVVSNVRMDINLSHYLRPAYRAAVHTLDRLVKEMSKWQESFSSSRGERGAKEHRNSFFDNERPFHERITTRIEFDLPQASNKR